MNFLSRLRLKTKLSLMVAVPLLAMLFFSTMQLIDKFTQQSEMEQLTELSGLASTLSALIHETQKERGASAGFTGSKGKKFVDILPKQRMLTNERRKQLSEDLQTFDASEYGAAFEEQLNALLSDLKQLDGVRSQVSALALPLSKVVGWYTAMNAKLLGVIEQMPHVVSDASLVTRMTAYVNYLQSKERAGIERAVLSATFGANQFAPGMYKKFISLVTAQENFLHVFNAMANEEDKAFYQAAMTHESIAKVEEMRQTAFQNVVIGGFGIDAEYWFKTITQKINQLKKVDDHLAAGILDQATALHASATTTSRLYLAEIALLLIFTLWLSRRVGRMIGVSVGAVRDALKQVADEGDFSVRVESNTQDSVGEMAQALNVLMESLQTSIHETNLVVTDIAHGVFDRRVEADLRGELLTLKNGVNESAASVERTMNTLSDVMQAISGGNFGYRLEGVEMEGEFRRVLENTMASMDSIVTDINKVMDGVAIGRFDVRVQADAQGDMDRLKQNLNRSLDALGDAMKEVVTVTNRTGEGDLTVSVEGDYHGLLAVLKDSVNASQANFSQIVSKVRASSRQVRHGSDEISRGSVDLSSRTSEQAASLEETAASMEEMASTVKMNSDSASQASQLAAESLMRAQDGSGVAVEAVEAMQGINESSAKIADIITLIDGIAFQTNLLALNAAVEAARAGEHGRGFAVVAGEVRTLAQRSADAAKDIKKLIEDSTSRIEQGSELVERSGVALSSIEESVKKMNDISSEIEAATKEQTQGINQVNTAVAQLDTATQENAALVEETAAASSQLSHQADELSNMVSVFTLSREAEALAARLASSHSTYAETFMKARSAHLAWKGKIRGFLDGVIQMDAKQAVSHHDCALGQWLDKEGRQQFKHLPQMKELDHVHEQMHTLIKEIVALKHDGKVEQAEQRFEEIEPLSHQVVALLNKLESAESSGVSMQQSTPPAAPETPQKPKQKKAPRPTPKRSIDDEWSDF